MDTVDTFVCRQQLKRNYKWRVQKRISWYNYVLYIFSCYHTVLSLEQLLIKPVDEYWLTRDSALLHNILHVLAVIWTQTKCLFALNLLINQIMFFRSQ